MRRQTLAAQDGFEKYGRKSRRDLFLQEMDRVVPWQSIETLIAPHYAAASLGGRPGVSIMLRIYFVQQWFKLSDADAEEALYDSASLQHFVGVNLSLAPPPDETRVCKFRHLLEKHELGRAMLDAVNDYLGAKGIRISTGEIVDAKIICVPSSQRNLTGEREPETQI